MGERSNGEYLEGRIADLGSNFVKVILNEKYYFRVDGGEAWGMRAFPISLNNLKPFIREYNHGKIDVAKTLVRQRAYIMWKKCLEKEHIENNVEDLVEISDDDILSIFEIEKED